jgi:hypothetical protein
MVLPAVEFCCDKLAVAVAPAMARIKPDEKKAMIKTLAVLVYATSVPQMLMTVFGHVLILLSREIQEFTGVLFVGITHHARIHKPFIVADVYLLTYGVRPAICDSLWNLQVCG